jgi:hypothetical protein
MPDDNAANRMALMNDDAVNDAAAVITIVDDDPVNFRSINVMGRAPRRSQSQETRQCCGRKSADRLHGNPPFAMLTSQSEV